MAEGDSTARLDVSLLRRRRGVVRASVTRLGNRLRELEDTRDQPATPAHAQQLYARLKDLDSNFKDLHMEVVDALELDEDVEAEQVILDKHDDRVSSFTVRLQGLINSSTTTPTVTNERERKSLSLKLSRLERSLTATDEAISALPEVTEDLSLVQQYQEQLIDYKKDLATLYDNIVALDPEEDDDLFTLHSRIEKSLFNCSLNVKKLMNASHLEASTATGSKGVKLP